MDKLLQYVGIVDIAVIIGFLISLIIVVWQLIVILGRKPTTTKAPETAPTPTFAKPPTDPAYTNFDKPKITHNFHFSWDTGILLVAVILGLITGTYLANRVAESGTIPKIEIKW